MPIVNNNVDSRPSNADTFGNPIRANQQPIQLSYRDVLFLMLAFASARVIYGLLGVSFDASPFPMFMQFIDRDLLMNRLLESIWNYHAFPPLLNVIVGIGLKLFGSKVNIFFSVFFHILGFLLALSVLVLTARLTASRWAAHIVSTVLIFSPAFVLYENWLMYELPAATLLTASAVALLRFVDTRRSRWGFMFFSLLAMLALTRSLFHLAWLVLVILLLVGLMRAQRRQILLVSILPLMVVASWYAKNYYLFGTFSTSTLMGLGMSNITTLTVPADELLPLVKNGTLSPFALVSRYRDLEVIFSSQKLPETGIPVLDRKYKASPSDSLLRSAAGRYNFNNQQIVTVNHYYTMDSLKTIQHFPYFYVTGLRISNLLFFSPSQMNLYFSAKNRDAVEPMERFFDPILYGVQPRAGTIMQPHWGYEYGYRLEVNPSVLLMMLWAFALPYGYMKARKDIFSQHPKNRSNGIVIAFIVGNALYVYSLGTLVELGENYRYKFLIEPLFLVLTAVVLTDLIRRSRATLDAIIARRQVGTRSSTRDNESVLPK